MERSKKYNGVYLNYLKNGDITFYFTYKDIDNRLKWEKVGKQSEGITQNLCNQKRIEVLNQIRLGEQPKSISKRKKKNIITLDEISEMYFEHISLKSDCKNSISRYNNHIKPKFGKKDINSITKKEIEKLQKEKAKKLADKTVNHIMQLFGTIYNYYNGEYKKSYNPASEVKKFKIDNTRDRYLSIDEVEKLLEEIKEDKRLTLFVKLSLCTGGRVSTIVNIKKKDIDLKLGNVNLKNFKTNSTYMGYLDKSTKELLGEYVQSLSADDCIFNMFGKVVIQKKLKVIFDKLFNVGLSPNDSKNRVVTHTLRHTFASHLAINGTPPFTIQKLMDHRTIQMTMRYAKLAPDSGKIMIEGLYK